MSQRFWMTSAAAMGLAVAGGVSLAAFVVSPSQTVPVEVTAFAQSRGSVPISTGEDPAMQDAPESVRCTGCGPTLTDRQMMAMNAGLDLGSSSSAPEVVAQHGEDHWEEDSVPAPPFPTSTSLPIEAQRLIASGVGASPPTVRPTLQPIAANAGTSLASSGAMP